MPLYALTIFLSAFLLFQVQPMAAKFILPWFGGSTLVWSTCMLFFQLALVAGYAYSHGVSTKLSRKGQLIVHAAIVLVALVFLPIRPADNWKPIDGDFPVQRILWILIASVGVPFFLLSTTGPLIQRWQSLTHPHQSPYRLYALSNVGSLLALISYPLIIERWFALDQQSWFWACLFVMFAVSLAGAGWFFAKQVPAKSDSSAVDDLPRVSTASQSEVRESRVPVWQLGLWLLLPALASVQLLATTNLMTQEIGAHPLLWVLPLGLYLLSFIICFESPTFYLRWLFAVGLFACSVLSCYVVSCGLSANAQLQIFAFCGVLFFSAMCCHGELVWLKPNPSHLTLYYLMISIGGSIGGIVVAVLAPLFFSDYYEFHLSLITIIVLMIWIMAFTGWRYFQENWVAWSRLIAYGVLQLSAAIALFAVLGFLYDYWRRSHADDILEQSRNAYGTLRVTQLPDRLDLTNGHTAHGFQLDDESKDKPVSYYGPQSGMGLAMRYLQSKDKLQPIVSQSVSQSVSRAGTKSESDTTSEIEFELSSDTDGQGIDIAAIGLGVGTIAAWTRPNDTIRFFEINSDVERVARQYFTYVQDAKGQVDITIGDARIQLERQREQFPDRKYDILVADAFSSDSIPVHLMTREAFQLYASVLKPGGIMAIHTSNRFLKLDGVVREIAKAEGWEARHLSDSRTNRLLYFSSIWVVLTKDPKFLELKEVKEHQVEWSDEKYAKLWTDESASLLQVLNWDGE